MSSAAPPPRPHHGIVPPRLEVRLSFNPDEKLFYADVLNLPGCSAFGETKEEAWDHVVTAIEQHMVLLLENAVRPRFAKDMFAGSGDDATEHIDLGGVAVA